jgi:ABC-type transport system involved in Fe-S cluster assembly fused permease/ATPase subunit
LFLKGSIFYKIGTGDADTILVMENGAIAESGNHTDLLEQKGKYFDLWNK